MPCIDLADAIISKSRETLINSINFINNSYAEFGGEVIYGDTDSMFVEFKNTTKEEAFRRAEKLCELITLANPNPIKLKLEKVYSECVLLCKY
jgi:DNA polymerase zeta